MTAIMYFKSFFNNLTNYERRHFKLFTKCLVSWDTLYFKKKRLSLNLS